LLHFVRNDSFLSLCWDLSLPLTGTQRHFYGIIPPAAHSSVNLLNT
jgi:hypothetical protein